MLVSQQFISGGFGNKAMHCKAKYTINLKLDPTLFDARDFILRSNQPKQWTLVCAQEKGHFCCNILHIESPTEPSFVNVYSWQGILPALNYASLSGQCSHNGWFV